MASVNRVIILGNLGQDPELRYTPGGAAVCTLRVATSENWTDREGNKQENTEWHNIVVWNKQAENCAKYLSKGRTVYVEGKLQTRSWDDKTTGQKKYATDVVAQNVTFINTGSSTSREQNPAMGAPNYSDSQLNASSFAPQQTSSNSGPGFGGLTAPGLDDIPF